MNLRRIRILCVVVDGADDDASCPGRNARERGPFESAVIVARFQVFHFAGMAGGNPFGKVLQFRSIGGRSDAREVEAGLFGGTLDDGFHVAEVSLGIPPCEAPSQSQF